MSPTIVEFSHCETDALFDLYAEVYGTAEGMSETFAEKYPTHDAFAADLADLHARPGAVALAALDAGRPVGYVTLRPRAPSRLRHTADLNIGVDAACRGQGLGTRLLAAALDRAAAAGIIEIVYLMVRADNAPAIRLYTAAGFDRLATLARDTKIGTTYHDGVLMRRFLAAEDHPR